MKLGDRVKKGWWSLQSEGPVTFTKKLGKFGVYGVRYGAWKVRQVLPEQWRGKRPSYSGAYPFLANPLFQINERDIQASKAVQKKPKPKQIKSATWFVPYFNHISWGGIYTIFRFINAFAEKGVHNRIVIYDNKYLNVKKTKAEIVSKFPNLASAEVVTLDLAKDKVGDLPGTDIGICTFWMSAYVLLRFNQTKRKYYFAQDYEPLFYEGGSMYALAESTYRFGFNGIVNTPGLLRALNQRHGMEGISFVPAVDRKVYYPSETPKRNKKIKIFFYTRPSNPRNAFELCTVIMQELVKKYGSKIQIITAGAKWNETDYNLAGHVTNLGLLKSIDEVADLYRTCDIGCVYMLSKHPSYQPFEFMASGMATVTNNNEDNLWFLQNGVNCLLAEPSPPAMAEKIGWLIEDKKLRQRIANNGIKSVKNDWDEQTELIWNDILLHKDESKNSV